MTGLVRVSLPAAQEFEADEPQILPAQSRAGCATIRWSIVLGYYSNLLSP